MSRASAGQSNNLVPLRPVPSPEEERAVRAAKKVRRQLSLLQGYADLMEGLSPKQNLQILQVIAEKTGELTLSLRPFIAAAGSSSPTSSPPPVPGRRTASNGGDSWPGSRPT